MFQNFTFLQQHLGVLKALCNQTDTMYITQIIKIQGHTIATHIGCLVLVESGKYESHEALVHHLVHGLCLDILKEMIVGEN